MKSSLEKLIARLEKSIAFMETDHKKGFLNENGIGHLEGLKEALREAQIISNREKSKK